ncbi:MAG: mechanosensitive ion channel [Candidatus Pacebacteria bacterium]|nr:mechanosensitive ion channel [Candidatus Paceibacterota bacterium]
MQEYINSFIQYATSAHPYMQALLIIAAAFFAAIIVLPFLAGLVKFLTRKTETDVDDKLIAALNSPVFYVVILIGANFALPLLGLSESAFGMVLALIKTILVIVVSQGILRVVRVLLAGAAETHHLKAVNEQTVPLFKNLSLALIISGALYAMFLVWGIDVTAWLASAGILGIAIGFAAKDTLSNLISGIFIMADKPYSVGDYIVLGSGTEGIVSAVGLRSTRIMTFNDEEVIIPNGIIANDALTNKTTGPDTGRVKLYIGVAYGSDLKKVETILLNSARSHKLVLDDPEPSVSFLDFGDSSLDFRLSCRVKNPLDVFGTASDLRYDINTRFAEENIEIPFPQRDVHMSQ